MDYKNFSHNGVVLPIDQASVPLSCIEYSYGFGVYEAVRVSSGVARFLDEHLDRLTESARIIGLEYDFSENIIRKSVSDLLSSLNPQTCNLKILLIGGQTKADAQIFIMCFNPVFPPKKYYKEGTAFITYDHERIFPHAKTLNMLQSYIAYKKARELGAYDALLINHEGKITEGTRTNFFCIKDKMIFSPSEKDILLGITRKLVLETAIKNGFKYTQKDISVADLSEYEGAFVTSTSSKIIPIKSINGEIVYEKPVESLKDLMKAFDNFLKDY